MLKRPTIPIPRPSFFVYSIILSFAFCDTLNVGYTLIPVSYTHLDVYKRQVILANSNPATIMTDTTIADKVYMEPLTPEYLAKIIRMERPDAIVPGIEMCIRDRHGFLIRLWIEFLQVCQES